MTKYIGIGSKRVMPIPKTPFERDIVKAVEDIVRELEDALESLETRIAALEP